MKKLVLGFFFFASLTLQAQLSAIGYFNKGGKEFVHSKLEKAREKRTREKRARKERGRPEESSQKRPRKKEARKKGAAKTTATQNDCRTDKTVVRNHEQ